MLTATAIYFTGIYEHIYCFLEKKATFAAFCRVSLCRGAVFRHCLQLFWTPSFFFVVVSFVCLIQISKKEGGSLKIIIIIKKPVHFCPYGIFFFSSCVVLFYVCEEYLNMSMVCTVSKCLVLKRNNSKSNHWFFFFFFQKRKTFVCSYSWKPTAGRYGKRTSPAGPFRGRETAQNKKVFKSGNNRTRPAASLW